MGRQGITEAERALYDQTNILPQRQLVLTFLIICLALLVTFIDQNGISVTLPTIAKDLNAEATIAWAGIASLLGNTVFQMLYGRLSDIFGRKQVFVGAVALLSVADLLCGLSRNKIMFYVFRAVAGIGGGGITNLANIIISDVVSLDQRGKYQGVIGGVVGLGNVLGPFIAAAAVYNSTWRFFFWALAPLAALIAILAYFFLTHKPPTESFHEGLAKVDWGGFCLSSIGIVLLLVPISGGGAYFAWNSTTVITLLVLGFVGVCAFLTYEWKIASLPIMPVVAQSMTSILSGQYINWRKRYWGVLAFGFGVWTLGAGIALKLGKNTGPGLIIVCLGLVGSGVGCIFQPTLIALQAHTSKRRRAVIISNRNLFRCAGGACGMTLSAVVLQARLRAELPNEYRYLSDSTYAVPNSTVWGVPAVVDSYMAASHAVFILQVPLIGLCFLGMALIRDRGLESPEDSEE
ncbi:hypothetical protein FGRMN_11210 [Fusarium graminum]|nr:hypothetical protein FGRMN_11210 [Fusarium graminum]